MRRYAEGTKVAVAKTKAEIETLAHRHGATGFLTAWDGETDSSLVQFRIDGRIVQLRVVEPSADGFRLSGGGRRRRSPMQVEAAVENERRRRWRATLLIMKAKLELVAGGESTIEREFLADIVLPNGSTVGEHMLPQLADAYETGGMPRLLLPGAG